MFIACRNKTDGAEYKRGVVSVLDTTDGTVECIEASDIIASGIRVYNFCKNIRGVYVPNKASLFEFLEKPQPGDVVRYVWQRNEFVFRDFKVKITYIGSTIHVNNVSIKCGRLYEMSCVFQFQDYLIIRFSIGVVMIHWLNFAVHKDGKVDYWSDDLTECTNKKIAMLVDTTSEV